MDQTEDFYVLPLADYLRKWVKEDLWEGAPSLDSARHPRRRRYYGMGRYWPDAEGMKPK